MIRFRTAASLSLLGLFLVAACQAPPQGQEQNAQTGPATIPKITNDAEDFTADADDENDGLTVNQLDVQNLTASIHVVPDTEGCEIYSVIIDWGDGTIQRNVVIPGTITHTYGNNGEYAIKVRFYCDHRLKNRDSDIVLI